VNSVRLGLHIHLIDPFGAGALEFAKAMGLKEGNLLTDQAREKGLRWRANLSREDNWLGDEERKQGLPRSAHRHDHLLRCLNATGELSGVTGRYDSSDQPQPREYRDAGSIAELQRRESTVDAVLNGLQFVMSAGLNNTPLGNDKNPVHVSHRGEAVGDNERSAPSH
jgi:hypothetical protein